MKVSHLMTIGATVALAAGAYAGVLILDDFSVAGPSVTVNGGSTASGNTFSGPLTSIPPAITGYYRDEVAYTTVPIGGGTVRVTTTIDPAGQTFNYFASDPATGGVKLMYGEFADVAHPELNLNRSMFTIGGAIGLYIAGWRSDFPVTLSVSIYANNSTAFGWQYSTVLPGGNAATVPDPLIVNGTLFSAIPGTTLAMLADIDQVVFDFSAAHQATDFHFTALGIPEPHQYAGMAGLGLLGFAAWRRMQKRA